MLQGKLHSSSQASCQGTRLPSCQPRCPAFQRPRSISLPVVAQAQKTSTEARPQAEASDSLKKKLGQLTGLGDALGPIGMTIGGEVKDLSKESRPRSSNGAGPLGIDLGPIGMTYGGVAQPVNGVENNSEPSAAPKSIHSMTTEQWRAAYERDGTIDLWVEEEFNAGSRLVGGREVHKGGVYGFRTGEGPTAGEVPKHRIKIFNHYADQVVEVDVPEDRYVLWEAEDNGLQLPYACRMGCCTACAVRVKEGSLYQPEALGISEELKQQGYALMCVGFPESDCVLETVPEDEVYELQFGETFAQQALNPTNPDSIERDDFALSIANMDE